MLAWGKKELAEVKGFKFWLILSTLMVLLAPLAIFEPFDWLQRGLTEQVNQKPYSGNGIIISIDRETVESLDEKVWTRTALASLLDQLQEAGAGRIYILRQVFGIESPDDKNRLGEVLGRLDRKAVWQVDLLDPRLFSPGKKDMGSNNAQPGSSMLSEISHLTLPSSLEFRQTSFGTPISLPSTSSLRGETILSISQIMAASDESVPSTAPRLGSLDVIDMSYRIDSIPTLSASQIFNGTFSSEKIEGRDVVITDVGDIIFTPQKNATPRAAIAILGAQTIIDGPQYQMYVWPGLIIALLVSIFWTILPPPLGKLVGLTGFVIIFLSPFILERFLFYQNTSHGLFFLTVFAIGRAIIRSRAALKSSRGVAETKSRFLAQASHDLRQPIHAIGLLAERLQQTDLSETQKDIVAKISWSTNHASRMFKSLLDLAILESGTLKPKMSSVAVNDLLAEIDNQNALIAEQADITLRFVPSEVTLLTDRSLANTILQNLVSNAIKYSDGGDILVGCRRVGGTIALCVYDQGQGISKKEVRLVSQEFYRGKKLEAGRTDGIGLGLAIVRGLTDLLELEFILKSNRGNGTAAKIGGFSIVKEEQQPPLPSAVEQNDILPGTKVLAIDDDVDTLQSTAGLLEMWGCRVVTATEMPKEELSSYDVILTDFDFGNGLTLSTYKEKIVKLRDGGTCLVIVSGHHPSHIKESLDDANFTILAKPVHPAELKSSLITGLSKKHW